MPGLKILLTSGATREPIDGVRYISNFSTGGTGAALADFFSDAGFEVTYFGGEGAAEPSRPCHRRGFTDFRSLDEGLKAELSSKDYFGVVHLAAVSDYSVHSIQVGDRSFAAGELGKVDSGEELGLVLRRNAKILDRLKDYARKSGKRDPLLVGFKLTHALGDEAAQFSAVAKLAQAGKVDVVVHNDFEQFRSAKGAHRFRIFRVHEGQADPGKICRGTDELGCALVETFKEFL